MPVDPNLAVAALDKDMAKSRHELRAGSIAGQDLAAELSPGTPGSAVKEVRVHVVISTCLCEHAILSSDDSRTSDEDVEMVEPRGQVWCAVRLHSAGNLLERTPAEALMGAVPEVIVVAANHEVERVAEDGRGGSVKSLWR